jgi:hypothetical protein
LERTFGERRLAGKVQGMRCNACGEEFIAAGDVGRFELGMATRLARIGLQSGDALRFMRKALALPIPDLAVLLDLPEQRIETWEASTTEVEDPAISGFAAMVIYRGAMRGERLRALARQGATRTTAA